MIELGGEDAKIIFLTGGVEQRMNGSCAGGTGAFIDQMATLLDVSVDQLDKMAQAAEKVYPIASRCGVFAKSDIQPLLNQGARREDIAASIFQAVVDQTVSGWHRADALPETCCFWAARCRSCKGCGTPLPERWNWTKHTPCSPKTAEPLWHTAVPCLHRP